MFIYRIWDSILNDYIESRSGNSIWHKIGGAKQMIAHIKRQSIHMRIVDGKKTWVNDFDPNRYVIKQYELVWREDIRYEPK